MRKNCKKGLTITNLSDIIQRLSNDRYLGVAQLGARYLGVVEAASSSLVTQIKRRFDRISFFLLFLGIFGLFGAYTASKSSAIF